jgi:hypothetical protein
MSPVAPVRLLRSPVPETSFLEWLGPEGSVPHIPREPTGLQHLTRATQPGPQYLALEFRGQDQGTVTQHAPHVLWWLWGEMTVATRSQDPAFSASHPTVALLSYFCTCRSELSMN